CTRRITTIYAMDYW
nr:immunoglobulin heavy chain junction region [Mus musculus]MBK4198462.1 immunoglobulin heavy chain junction region [Mus musculus]